LSRLAHKNVFEGMCNPPGGDWSGISLLAGDTELRWLSLPRMGQDSAKRPDHVFQIFGISEKPIVFILESKETGQAVEKQIGKRLLLYLTQLLSSAASCERPRGTNVWKHSVQTVSAKDIQFATGVAFLGNNFANISKVLAKSECDIIFGLDFLRDAQICEIRIITQSDIGETIGEFIEQVASDSELIVVKSQ